MTIDETADSLLMRVAAFFGECISDDTFCGLSLDEVRDADGKIQGLQLVACDSVGGEPVRRIEKLEKQTIVRPSRIIHAMR